MNGKKPWEAGRLTVSENGRYLKNGDTPFFWLGDTAWLLFHELTTEETKNYFRNRLEKGFTIILSDFTHGADQKNRTGSCALIDGDFARPDTSGDFWDHIDEVISLARDMGLYMGILPAWGSAAVKPGTLNMDNVEAYVDFVAKRYGAYENLVWIVGGDVRGDVNEAVFNRMGELLKEKMPDKLVGYHPFGRTSSTEWFCGKDWLDFHMFQSGHRRYDQMKLNAWDDNVPKENWFGEDNWKYVFRDQQREPNKPTIDGEPSYEHVLQGLHDETQPYWQARDVRRYAYWPVFAGAFGHTYGDNSIMQFHKDKSKKGAFGAKDTWMEALHHPGSGQMKHLKELITSVDYQSGKARDELVIRGQGEQYERKAVFAGEDYLFCYDYAGTEFVLNLKPYTGKKLDAYWFDPESGIYSYIETIEGGSAYAAMPSKKADTDWVLVLKAQ